MVGFLIGVDSAPIALNAHSVLTEVAMAGNVANGAGCEGRADHPVRGAVIGPTGLRAARRDLASNQGRAPNRLTQALLQNAS